MRRFLIFLVIGTGLALGYVQQRVTLVSLGYQVEKLRHAKEELLDQRRVLHYNVLALQSPVILNQRLVKRDVKMAPPQRVEVVARATDGKELEWTRTAWLNSQPTWFDQVRQMAAGWITGGREAEAKPALEDR